MTPHQVIADSFKHLLPPDAVVELRIPNTRRGTVSGYFNSPDELAAAAARWSGKAVGVYCTINPVNPALLARANNRLVEYVKHTTSDTDILRRCWLLLDFDPGRPAGISSTDTEHEAALARAGECVPWLRSIGFTAVIVADSGNGAHVLVRIDLPNDAESTALIKRCLAAVALRFSDDAVSVDLSVHNAARIWKLYGTLACKGDSSPERPHRLARLLEAPAPLPPVSRDLLEKLAAMAPEEAKAHARQTDKDQGAFALERWIADHTLAVRDPSPWQGGRKWIFSTCPWNADHTDHAAYLIQFASGAIAAGCHHNGCQGKGWPELRDAIEPGWREKRAAVHDTYRKAAAGQPTTGLPKLKDYLPEEIVDTLYKWCGEISPNPPKPDTSKAPPDKRGPSQATQLVTLAENAVFFHTPDQEAWATITTNGHKEHWPLKTRSFRRWLARRFYEREKKAASTQALQDALGVLEGKALFDGAEHPVFVRVAAHSGAIYLDLANDRWEAIEITPLGWRVVENPPVRFRRTKGMSPLPTPVPGGSVEQLKPFVNTRSNEDWVLLIAWLLMAYSPRGPYPVLDLTGEQGSAKSTRARVLRSLIDPSSAPLRAAPRDERDLMISAQAVWVLAFDNLSYLPQWLSDAFCRLATGGGLATRELYSDAEEVLFDAQRPVLFTGIEDVAVSGDLLDRSIRLSLSSIPESQRQPESVFWQEFEAACPAILGAVLTVVSAALRNQSNVKLERLPRMADFAVWVTAAEEALGWQKGTFLSVYAQNREAANELALESSLVAGAVQALVGKGTWEGTAKELLDTLTEPLSEKDAKAKTWPKTPLALSNALRRLASNLRAVRISVEFYREPGGKRHRKVRIMAIEEEGNGASLASLASQNQQNQGFGGTLRDAETAFRDASVPPSSSPPPSELFNEIKGSTQHGTLRDARDDEMRTHSNDQYVFDWARGEQNVSPEDEGEVIE